MRNQHAVNPKKFKQLGQKGNEFKGLEVFTAPEIDNTEYTSDEVTAVCPVTGQPDWYTVTIVLSNPSECIESKSLKLYLQSFRNQGIFCEGLAHVIAEYVNDRVSCSCVEVTVRQKPRGGVSIKAIARRCQGDAT